MPHATIKVACWHGRGPGPSGPLLAAGRPPALMLLHPLTSVLLCVQVYKVLLNGVEPHAAKVFRIGSDPQAQLCFLEVGLGGGAWVPGWLLLYLLPWLGACAGG